MVTNNNNNNKDTYSVTQWLVSLSYGLLNTSKDGSKNVLRAIE